MTKYIIVHCKHEGCYETGAKAGSIKINTPIIFLFNDETEAKEFFYSYMNDVDVIDEQCKTSGEDLDHKDHCSCGIVDVDKKDGKPILFYNKKNQIFLLEQGAQLFTTPINTKIECENYNITNNLLAKTKTLSTEQKKRYIELGKRCQQCLTDDDSSDDDDEDDDSDSDNGKKLFEKKTKSNK